MCIINSPAEVTQTEIFVTPNFNYTRQLVIYANRVNTQDPNNVMILPVPHPSSIQLHNLTDYSNIFKDCDQSFPPPYQFTYTNGTLGMSRANSLEVVECGSYQVSIVPHLQDFHKLNTTYFQLNPSTWEVLGQHYRDDFGFLVCKLKSGGLEKYHPLSYSHNIYRPHQMFVPTRHHHGHQIETLSDYDHKIYSVNTTQLCGSQDWNGQFWVNMSRIPNFQFPEINTFNLMKISKKDLNTDLYFHLDHEMLPLGQVYGVDGCLFKTNHSGITFKNVGSIYQKVFFRGFPFYDANSQEVSFAGTGTYFSVDGNRIQVRDDVGTSIEHELSFKFDPLDHSRSGVRAY